MLRGLAGLLVGGMLVLGFAGNALAVPAPPFPIVLDNGDGPVIWGRMFGDEHLSWVEDLDGWTLRRDPATGRLHYAEVGPDGYLRPTAYEHGTVDPKALGLSRHLMPSKQIRREIRSLRDGLLGTPARAPSRVSGDICNLVILVRFADESNILPSSDFEPVFNAATDSVREYYDEVSYGSVNMISTITDWVTLPNNGSYYAYNDSTYGHPERMIRDAADILDSQGFDFSQFDCDGDGEIDAVDVIHSGHGYETSHDPDDIHSHYAALTWYGDDFYKDGVHFVAYHTEPEVQSDGYSPTQIGVIVHETGHFFGLPDLYDYDYDSGGIGLWGVMCSGPWAGPGMDGTVPTHFSIWSKYQLDWVTPQYIQANVSDVRLRPAYAYPEGIRVNAGMPYRQYFLAENRRKDNYDAYLPGEGLLIFHVDENVSDNNNQSHYLVDLEQADGQRELNNSVYENGDTSDPWPYSGKDAFTPNSTPSSVAYGQNDSDISILNITRSGSDILLDVNIDGSAGSLLSVSPGSLAFAAGVGAQSPPAQTVTVNHQGVGPLSWTASAQNNWISVSPTTGSTPGSTQVTVNPAGLSEGTHTGSIRFTSPSADNSPVTMGVTLNLTQRPASIALSTTTMDFVGVAGGPSPAPKVVTVSNTGGGSLSWTASADANWINLSTSSGGAPTQVVVTANSQGLASGYYQGSVHFVTQDAGEAWLDVSLSIQLPAHIVASPLDMDFSSVFGRGAPEGQALTISNTSGGQMPWSVTCSPGWLECGPTSGNAPGQVWVQPDPAAMDIGQYAGTITIEADVADNSPVTIPVVYDILPQNTAPSVPTPVSPAQGLDIEDPNPELTVENAGDTDGDVLTYDFEVYDAGSNQVYWSTQGVVEGISFTSVRIDKTLDVPATYQWRARAVDQHGMAGEWSEKVLFTVLESGSGGKGCGCGTDGRGSPLGGLAVALIGLLALVRRRT